MYGILCSLCSHFNKKKKVRNNTFTNCEIVLVVLNNIIATAFASITETFLSIN